MVKLPEKAMIAGPVSEEQILDAEKELGLVFPQEYREFLKQYGAVLIVGYELAGIYGYEGDGPPMWQNIVSATKQNRKANGEHISQSLIPITHDGMGLEFYLDTSSETSGRVIAIGPDVDEKVVSGSFSGFLQSLIDGDNLV